MALLKKIIIPLILFIMLIVFSVNEFDYERFSSTNDQILIEEKSEIKEIKPKEELSPTIVNKNREIEEIINKTDEDIEVINNEPLNAKEVQELINNVLSLSKINFERRSTDVTKESKIALEQIVKILKDNSTFQVEIAGHTDSRGVASLNKKISEDRASSVFAILVSMGIDKNRLKAVGYGEDSPLVKEDNRGLAELNRRVEFNILGEQ